MVETVFFDKELMLSLNDIINFMLTNIATITAVLAIVLSYIAIRETAKAQKSALLLELIKQESSLQLEVRKAKPKNRKEYLETYLNFFEGLYLLWNRNLIKEDARSYFKEMIFEAAESEYVQDYISEARKNNFNAFKNFEELYKNIGGKKWLKKKPRKKQK